MKSIEEYIKTYKGNEPCFEISIALDDDDEFEQVKMENKDDNQTKDEGNGIEHSEESRLLPNLVKQKDNKNKISVEGYTLEITKPHIDTDNGIISYTRKYTATHEQYGPFTFVLTRARTTAAIASYYYLFFNSCGAMFHLH